jgi:diacylglycerol O-acyltransferase / wax synthase
MYLNPEVGPVRSLSRERETPKAYGKKYGKKMDNLLDPRDQSMFDFGRATGITVLIQSIWVYNRAIDIDGLRQFHDHLQRGRLSRRIERSPLRFGRHHWVAPNGSSDIEIVASARPREEFDAWLGEQVKIPLDCERGPVWHLAAFPFTDGGTGVSLLIPHCLTDGLGLFEGLAEAAFGRDDPVSWPAAASRRRWQALREDARQTARDIPAFGRGVAAAVRMARRSRGGAGSATPLPTTPAALPAGVDEPITLPIATMFVNADEWEARAHSLGGTSNTLLAGLAARLAEQRGRVTADGLVTLRIPVNVRTPGDTRGNATSPVDITVDPAPTTTDLREIRAAIKQALIRHREMPDEERALLSLVPLLPKRLIRMIPGNATGVISTHLGVINPAATRADGTDADYFAVRMHYPGMTAAMMHRFRGLQIVGSGRAHGQVFFSALAYQPGRANSNDDLRHDLSSALKDFSLTGTHI